MKLQPEDSEHHSCGKCYGKAVACTMDRAGLFYCSYCNKKLLDSQVDGRVKKKVMKGGR